MSVVAMHSHTGAWERDVNSSLCKRFGIDTKNAAQVSSVIKAAVKAGNIKVADPEHPRAGYLPCWV